MSLQDVHALLVIPVTALEEYVKITENVSPIVEVICMSFRKILNQIEDNMNN